MRCLLILLVACGGEAKRDEPPPEPKPTPDAGTVTKPEPKPEPAANPQPGLTAVMDGKPITVQTVLAGKDSNGQVRLHLYNYPTTCDPITKGWSDRSSQSTDLDLSVRIGRYLHPDGQLGLGVRGMYWHPPVEKGSLTIQNEKADGAFPLPPGTVVDADAGKTFEVPLSIELKSNDDSKRTLSIKGTAKVTGCGDEKLKRDDVQPAHQAGAAIVIAKQELPIGGAAFIVKRDGSRQLVVATHDVVCVDGSNYVSAKWPDVKIELEWNKAGELESVEQGGAWVDWGNGDAGTIKGSPSTPPRGAKEMTIALSGETTVAGYAVALKGKVKATVCPTPK